jgi:hypothetical protein
MKFLRTMNTTDWIVGANPVRPGMYQRNLGGTVSWAYWNGNGGHCWMRASSTQSIARARAEQGLRSPSQHIDTPWRGITGAAANAALRQVVPTPNWEDRALRLKGLINRLAMMPADVFYRPGDYAAGEVNEAWREANAIMEGP